MSFIAGLVLKISFLIAAVGGVFVGKKYLHTKDDDVAEELVEEVINKTIHVDIDLTPESKEDEKPSLLLQEIAQTVAENIK